MQTGHVPQGLVMGTCVYHIAHRGLGQTLGSVGQNVELPNFTQALYEARELAMTRMQDEAERLPRPGSSASGWRKRATCGAAIPSSFSRENDFQHAPRTMPWLDQGKNTITVAADGDPAIATRSIACRITDGRRDSTRTRRPARWVLFSTTSTCAAMLAGGKGARGR